MLDPGGPAERSPLAAEGLGSAARFREETITTSLDQIQPTVLLRASPACTHNSFALHQRLHWGPVKRGTTSSPAGHLGHPVIQTDPTSNEEPTLLVSPQCGAGASLKARYSSTAMAASRYRR